MSQKVVVLGGGVAGMSAAHELMERGFKVAVYEKQPETAGGKARSVNVPGTNQQHPDKYLPGEHGFRFFPGFYRHVTDTMKRIPFPGNKQGVYDNLTEVNRMELARYGRKPIQAIVNFPQSFADLRTAFDSMHADTGLTGAELKTYTGKIWQLITSCQERRMNEYERLGWWEFMDADNQSENYQSLLVEGMTRSLVAAKARTASTKTNGDILLQLIFNTLDPLKHTDRVLNGPTNDVWIDPWLAHLRAGGVEYNLGCEVQQLEFDGKMITGAWISRNGAPAELVTGDHYILAVPVEAADKLITDEMIAHDPILNGIRVLAPSVSWMTGLQFYLNEEVDIVHGHCIYADTPWAITSISQMQFWKSYDLKERGNGRVKTILSIDISNWEVPGLNGKRADECTPEEIKAEAWAQMKKSLNYGDVVILRDDMVEGWYLDRDIAVVDGKDVNYEPLLVNRVHTWDHRPKAYTYISNLFLAADYVRTYTDLATMEGANEAARRAVNSIIDCSGSSAPLCPLWDLHDPEVLEIYRMHDRKRFHAGLPYKHHESLMEKAMEWAQKVF